MRSGWLSLVLAVGMDSIRCFRHQVFKHGVATRDAPERRLVESPGMGRVSAIPKVRGLHHYYTRLAA